MAFKLHASGLHDYSKALKEAYRNLVAQVDKNKTIPPSEKKAEIDRLKIEYDKKRKLAPYGLY